MPHDHLVIPGVTDSELTDDSLAMIRLRADALRASQGILNAMAGRDRASTDLVTIVEVLNRDTLAVLALYDALRLEFDGYILDHEADTETGEDIPVEEIPRLIPLKVMGDDDEIRWVDRHSISTIAVRPDIDIVHCIVTFKDAENEPNVVCAQEPWEVARLANGTGDHAPGPPPPRRLIRLAGKNGQVYWIERDSIVQIAGRGPDGSSLLTFSTFLPNIAVVETPDHVAGLVHG